MAAIIDVVLLALRLYIYVIVILAVMSWLVAFDVINTRNNLVRSVLNGLEAITEPVLRPIRNVLPNLGGLDVSPIILWLLIVLIEDIIIRYIQPYVY